MHRSYRFDVRSAVRAGTNTLRIRFASALAYAEGQSARLGSRPAAYSEPFNFIRKMACNFGWDWGPTLVTAGIWQPIGLDAWSVARLRQRPAARDGRRDDGMVDVRVDVERAGARGRSIVSRPVSAAVAGRASTVPAGAVRRRFMLRRRRTSARWWPRGYGEQPLYALAGRSVVAGWAAAGPWRRQIGFRTVGLDTTPDENGTPFTLVVNGEPVFVRGANWIPDDCFPTRITPGPLLATRLDQAIGANINLLRVWGGGLYESEDFYDALRRARPAGLAGLPLRLRGLPRGGAAAPRGRGRGPRATSPGSRRTRAWCCGTATTRTSGATRTGAGRTPLDGRTWGRGLLLRPAARARGRARPDPAVLARQPVRRGRPGHSPQRPSTTAPCTSGTSGTRATTPPTASTCPRFVAEFGFQAPARPGATLPPRGQRRPLAPTRPALRITRRPIDGNVKLTRGLADALCRPRRDFDDWHYLTQLNQARAVRSASSTSARCADAAPGRSSGSSTTAGR